MSKQESTSDLELWGGIECTVNRIGDHYFDQLARSGHDVRLDDLDRFAELGLRTLRYPILWERIAPNGLDNADWTWADERLGRLRELNIRPIVGLCHHGSGPRATNLLDAAFPGLLADFAAAVAERYPWVDAYTPVNEPLTTARFAALYGFWYPHHRDEGDFLRALLHQCAAVAQAMERIRRVNPAAQLIQTEDLGKTFSVPELAYQAEFDNHRRWLTFDLLCGRVDPAHPLWRHLIGCGLDEALLHRFVAEPCPPDVLGLNYYVTGERFLDHRLEHYPPHTHGGNGRHAYADIEAVRVLGDGISGPVGLVREAWDRYQLPIAITEAHLGCTREEQVRWLVEVWEAGLALERDGVDIRAVTVWSVLGAFDWHVLLTRQEGYYEPGAFDVRGPAPRPTALATTISDLIRHRRPSHPLAHQPGWWRRQTRLHYPAVHGIVPASARKRARARASSATPVLLIVGAGDQLELALAGACANRGIPIQVARPGELSITDEVALAEHLRRQQAWAVIDATPGNWLDPFPSDVRPLSPLDTRAAATLAAACGRLGVRLLTFSSDHVFDGTKPTPYLESDPIAPRSARGRHHAAIEREVLAAHPHGLIVRTSPVFGLHDLEAFARGVADVRNELPVDGADQTTTSLTFAPDLIAACLDSLVDGECGILHLANPGAMAWADLTHLVGYLTGVNPHPGVDSRLAPRAARRPVPPHLVLASERTWIMPSLGNALVRYLSSGPVVSRSRDQAAA